MLYEVITGEKRAAIYNKLGINTVYDLLYYFPRSYLDLTAPVAIRDSIINDNNVIKA